MNLIDFCIRRPAFTIVLSLLLTLVGLMGYLQLPVRWLPNISYPAVTLYATYPGANATLIEKQVTTPLEMALAGVDGVTTISSHSKQGQAAVMLEFKLGANVNVAADDVRASLERARYSLPKEVQFAVSKAADEEEATSILQLAFFDDHRSIRELSDYTRQFIAPRFENVDGVGSVITYGDQSSVLRVSLDPQKMAALNVATDDVNRTLAEQNLDFPSGQIKGKDRYYPVMTHSSLEKVEDFNSLVVRHHQNQTVRLKDVGSAEIEARDEDSFYRVNGKPAVGIAIIPKSAANPLEVSSEVLKIYQELLKTLPANLQGKIVYNQADYIHASIINVYEAIGEAVLCVLAVILIFFASWRAALIPIVTVPVCLIASFAILYFFRFSINTISLMALALAIGLVVDDAIVMLENIMRHREAGKSAWEAAQQGGREIVFSIIAMTITLASVYAPIAFASGLIGKLFSEFTYTLAGAVIISGFVALTLSPMMCSRLLPERQNHGAYGQWLEKIMSGLQTRYQRLLSCALTRKGSVLLFLGVMALMIYGIFHWMPSQLAPLEDTGKIQVMISAPRDASAEYTAFYMHQLEALYREVPEIHSHDSWSWQTGAYQTLHLGSPSERRRSTLEIVNWLNKKAEAIPGIRTFIMPEASPLASLAGGFSNSHGEVNLAVMTTRDYRQLHDVMQLLVSTLRENPLFTRVDNRLKWDGEQFDIHIDREKAADMQVSVSAIANTISTLIAGHQAGYFNYGGNRYEVLVQLPKLLLANPRVTQQLYVRNEEGKMLPLSSLINWEESTAPESLPHYNRLRSDNLSAMLASGASMDQAIKAFESTAKKVLPADVTYEFTSEAKSYLESTHQMALTFFLALVFIYFVLVAQFESFIDPLTILLSVPFAAGGALFTLKMAGGSINIYSCIGLVTLIGLISKHGILITDFANRKRAEGKTLVDAVIEGASLRLRPILMTTAAMVLGALPLAFASGPGAESRQQIGWIIVGGLLFGTFFSLIVVPVVYCFLARD